MRRVVLPLALALALGACGRKGPPVAPEFRLPQPVADLRGEVSDGAIELNWTNPDRRVDNTRLRDLTLARVFRSDDAGSGEPRPALLSRGRILGYAELATIRLASAPTPPPAGAPVVEGTNVRVTDRQGLTPGRRYSYVVLTEDSEGRVSRPSDRLSLSFIAAPEPPRQLSAAPGEGEVRLRWMPPARLVDGSPVSADITYEVLRAPGPEAPAEAVLPVPAGATELLDRGLVNDRTYHYGVRALRREVTTLARGAPSERVAATPRDMTPPSPPTDLVAIPAGGGVRLSWRASPEPDVAVYIVYRAEPGGAFTRIGTATVPATAFVDGDLAPGTYRYAVSAQDSGAQPNESGRSSDVTVRLP
jgi:hypothetical protein